MEPGSEQMLIGAAIGAIIGLLIGYMVGRRTAPGAVEARDLELKLEETRAEQRNFQERVTEHFAESAEKLNRLSEQYREVFQHLAVGAETLVGEGASGAFRALEAPAENPAIEADNVVAEPPRDYAPKTSPDDPGVLNENFGLDKDAPPGSSGSPKS